MNTQEIYKETLGKIKFYEGLVKEQKDFLELLKKELDSKKHELVEGYDVI